ncbi:MAG: glycosyltransferase family 87 protein [Terracidiphilus sp.]
MTRDRMDGLQIVLLGGVLVFLIGAIIARVNPYGMSDFIQSYYAPRCLMQHHDPYQESQLWAVYTAEAQTVPSDPVTVKWLHEILLAPNLPTTMMLFAPLALLPWNAAVSVWMAMIAASFFVAGFLVWRVCADSAPRYAAALVFLLFVTSGVGLSIGNTASLVVGFCVIAVWCFVSEQFVWVGILCLAVSLANKPHDAGIIWLYFLLAGGVARKRALQTLAVTALIALPAVLWISHVVPHWPQELSANLHAISSRGGQNDPGPHSGGGFGVMMTVNLQVIFSRIKDDPGFYNPVVYLLCGVPLALWTFKTLRLRYSPAQAWYALAAAAPFAMLAVYHRYYDCRLLLVAVPACVDLWRSRSPVRWYALAVTLAGILVTGDLLWVVVFHFTKYSGPSLGLAIIPAPIAIAVLGVFYLWVYWKRSGGESFLEAAESRA